VLGIITGLIKIWIGYSQKV